MPRKLKGDQQLQGKKRRRRGAGKSEHEDDDSGKSERVDALAMTMVIARKQYKVKSQSSLDIALPIDQLITIARSNY